MNLKDNKKKIFVICGLLLLIMLSAFVALFILNKQTPPLLEVGLLEIDDHTLTIHPSKKYLSYQETNQVNERLLYCLNEENSTNTCNWQESAIFQIAHNHTYYVYIKSTNTNLISKPEIINYSIPDYTNDINFSEK